MTQREKTLATGLLGLLGLVVSIGLLWFFAWLPFTEASERVESAQALLDEKESELTRENQSIKAIEKIDPRLEVWSDLSLPPPPKPKPGQKMTEDASKGHITLLQVDYEKFLDEMLRNHRFDQISVQVGQVEKQQVAKGKQPLYERIAFRLSGRGELSSVMGFMEEFHKAPLLHQIRNATIEQAGAKGGGGSIREGDLDMKLTVEALLVNGAKERPALVPEKEKFASLRVMADPPRNYYLMTAKNVFYGVKPPPPPPPEEKNKDRPKVDTKPTRPKEKLEDVARFVKLTMLCYDPARNRWEASVYDQARGGSEMKLNTGVFKDLTIYDRYEEVSLDARVIYIDETQLIFRVDKDKDKKYYRMRLGDFVGQSLKTPLDKSEVKELGLDKK